MQCCRTRPKKNAGTWIITVTRWLCYCPSLSHVLFVSLFDCFCLSRVYSWRDLISQLVVADQAQDGYTIADIIDCIKWELSHLIRVPGSRLQIALDLRTLKVNAHPPQMSLACVKFVNVKSPSLTPLCVCLLVLLYSRSAFCKWAALQVNNQSACKRGGGLPDAQPGQSTRTAQGSSATSGSRCDQPKFCIKNC